MLETKTTLNEDTLKAVQGLIEINIDSSDGFQEAAEKVENTEIANYFRRCSTRRKQFANALQDIVAANGETPETDGSFKAAMHRWWLDIRGTVQSEKEVGVLSEAERGEDVIKEKYEEVLRKTSGSAMNAVLLEQFSSIKEDHDTIRDMRDARK